MPNWAKWKTTMRWFFKNSKINKSSWLTPTINQLSGSTTEKSTSNILKTYWEIKRPTLKTRSTPFKNHWKPWEKNLTAKECSSKRKSKTIRNKSLIFSTNFNKPNSMLIREKQSWRDKLKIWKENLTELLPIWIAKLMGFMPKTEPWKKRTRHWRTAWTINKAK